MPITQVAAELSQAADQAQSLIRAAVQECGGEVSHLCSSESGLEKQAKCFIKNYDAFTSEACSLKVHNAMRHLPAAFHVERTQAKLGVQDFGKRINKGCNVSSDVLPYIWSYHIHLQWDFTSTEGHDTAMNFTKLFLDKFQPDVKMCHRFAFLTDLWNKGSVPADKIQDHPFADICEMATMPPGGPFFHAEKGFAISTTMFHRVVPWLMANRPLNDKLYIMIHPNSGCQYNDLRHWSMWIGNSLNIFYDILQGCVWAACEDEVMGCIAFNHLDKSQGYGVCYDPPTSYGKPGMSIDCKMTIDKDSNTTTESCTKPDQDIKLAPQVEYTPLPKTMMAGALTKRNYAGALKFNHSVNFEDMKYLEIPVPVPESDQVLIKVEAASINPCEWKFPMGMESPLDFLPSYPLVLGRDCIGTVVSVGSGATRVKVGDVVWANQGPFKQGCASTYAALKEEIVARAPTKLPIIESGVLPLVSLTALDALRFAGINATAKNMTVLILGGSGGVGHVAIQMAKAWGASNLITTCGTSHVEFCSSMGSDKVIDYHKEDWHTMLAKRSVDAVIDMVGLKGTGDKAYDILRENGFFVTLLPFSLPSISSKMKRPDIKHLFSNTVYWHHQDLELVADLVDAGKLKPHIDKTFSFEELVPAFHYLMEGHTTGKISVVPVNTTAHIDAHVVQVVI